MLQWNWLHVPVKIAEKLNLGRNFLPSVPYRLSSTHQFNLKGFLKICKSLHPSVQHQKMSSKHTPYFNVPSQLNTTFSSTHLSVAEKKWSFVLNWGILLWTTSKKLIVNRYRRKRSKLNASIFGRRWVILVARTRRKKRRKYSFRVLACIG